MSISYIPYQIEMHRVATDCSRSPQETNLKSDMDFGSHLRSKGDGVTRTLKVTLTLNAEQINLWEQFYEIVKSKVWYSTFPDAATHNFDPTDFFAFSFDNEVWEVTKKSRITYELSLELYWHYKILPLKRA